MPNLTIALTKPRLKSHNCGSKSKTSSVLEDITAHTEFQSVIFFGLGKEKDPYCNFLQLHLVKR